MRHPAAQAHRSSLRICTFGIISPHPDDFLVEEEEDEEEDEEEEELEHVEPEV